MAVVTWDFESITPPELKCEEIGALGSCARWKVAFILVNLPYLVHDEDHLRTHVYDLPLEEDKHKALSSHRLALVFSHAKNC